MFNNLFIYTNDIIKNENENSCVICGDSIQILKKIKSSSVDLIFADPPYGIGKNFGVIKDKFSNIDEYFQWCKIWIDESMRILKQNGTMYFISSTQYMPILDRYVMKIITLKIVLFGYMILQVYNQRQNLDLFMNQY